MGLIINKKEESPIIIVGCGDLGINLIEYLHREDVVIIDNNKNAFSKLPSDFECTSIIGDAAEIFILNNIQIEKAAAVILTTNNDNTNILVAQIAKEIFNIPYVAAYLHNPERECVYREFDINIIYPARITAKIIDNILHDTAKSREVLI